MPGNDHADLPINWTSSSSDNGSNHDYHHDQCDNYYSIFDTQPRTRRYRWPLLDAFDVRKHEEPISKLDQVTRLRSPRNSADGPDGYGVGPPSALVTHYSSSEVESSAGSSSGRHSPQTSLSAVCQDLRPKSEPLLPPHTDIQSQKLLDLQARTKYDIVQRNGQRIYGPPPNWDREPPTKGSEVFVGRVPRDCFEDELVPVFERVGMIYELRLMMDFSGSNRGFFFVRYTCVEDAKRACRELDNYEIRKNKHLGVLMSVDNRKLWISGIPNNITAEEIKKEMLQMTSGVTDVILYRNQTDKSKTRKYAFVEYESHRAAALARRRLVPSKICLKGQEIEKVDWAEPEDEPDEDTMASVKVLFVRNLNDAVTEDMLREKFNQWSDDSVERVKKTKDFAFVHFKNRYAAEVAKRNAMGGLLDGEPLEVEWSKPVDKNIYNQRKHLTKVLSSPGSLPPVYPPTMNGLPSAFGIRGAPGTAPPRNLLRKLGAVGHPGHNLEPNPSPMGPMGFDPIIKAIYEMKLSQSQPSGFFGMPGGVEVPYGAYPFGVPSYPPVSYAHPPYLAAHSVYPPQGNVIFPRVCSDPENENGRA